MRSDETLLAVIVLNKTRLEDSKTFASLTACLKASSLQLDLLIYDNSPEYNPDSVSGFPNWKITYMADTSNSGVSKAYNCAASLALASKKQWLLLFDQDTSFPLN